MSSVHVGFLHTYELVILGNDMALAARPASVVQLVHALYECGYELVVPLSWGEELLSQYTLDALGGADERSGPRILCVCPRVHTRLHHAAKNLTPHLLTGVAPPVATARFLRALQPDATIRITYVGACEGAKDPSIDIRVLPADLLLHLEKLGVVITEQPTVFESIVPPDRRRHWSLPGGAPSLQALHDAAGSWTYRELPDDDIVEELAESILANECTLIDLAASVGCHCAGGANGRDSVIAMEPPRAAFPVVSSDSVVALELGMESLRRPLPTTHTAEEAGAGIPSPDSATPEPRRYAVTPSTVELFNNNVSSGAEPNEATSSVEPAPAPSTTRPIVHEVWSVARAAAHTKERRRRTPRHFTTFAAMLTPGPDGVNASSPHPVPAPSRALPELVGTPAPPIPAPNSVANSAGFSSRDTIALDVIRTPAPVDDPRLSPEEVFPLGEVGHPAPQLGTTPTEPPLHQVQIAADDISWGPPELITISKPVSTRSRSAREPRRVPGPGPSRRARLWTQLFFVVLVIASTLLAFVVFRQLGR